MLSKIILAVALAAVAAAACPARADESLVGKQLVTFEGQPFCQQKDELQEYFLAMVQKDRKWMSQLTSCGSYKGNLKIAIIEEYDGSEIGHVVKARLFTPAGSEVGYTVSIGLHEPGKE